MNESFSYKSDLRVLRVEISDPSESKVQGKLILLDPSIIIVCFYFSLAFPPGTLRDVIRGENVAVRRLFLILQGDWSIIGLL